MARNVLLTLGLVSIPIKVDKATDKEESFRTVCAQGHDPAGVRQSTACPVCDNSEYSTFVKARKTDVGYVVLTPEELTEAKALPDSIKQSMALSAHPREDVFSHTVIDGNVYNLLPGKGVDPAQYATVVEAVRRAEDDGTAIVTQWAYRSKPAMYVIRARGDLLTANEIAWPERVRVTVAPGGEPNEALVQQFTSLIGMSTTAFDPDAYRDFRAETIESLLASKDAVESGDPADEGAPKPAAIGSTNIADQLAAALASMGSSAAPDYDSMSKADLVEECRRADLPVSGTKAELIERLTTQAAA